MHLEWLQIVETITLTFLVVLSMAAGIPIGMWLEKRK